MSNDAAGSAGPAGGASLPPGAAGGYAPADLAARWHGRRGMPGDAAGQAAGAAGGGAAGAGRVAWIAGSAVCGEPASSWAPPAGESGASCWAGMPAGLDGRVLLDALAAAGRLAGEAADQEEILGQRAAAPADPESARRAAARLAAVAVEYMVPGPALAGWLAVARGVAGQLDEDALVGLAAGSRRLEAWAGEARLCAAAQITARAAEADPKIGVLADGRPARVCADALGQIGLAEVMSGYRAAWWADLAVMLAWRLPQVGQALSAGAVDLDRARIIAEATAVLAEEKARAVAGKVLPRAGSLVHGELKDRCRRAVLAADPGGADERQQTAEANARVRLYPDDEGTATLSGQNLPAVLAAAAMSKLTAMARARKAAGQGGPLDLDRAQVMIGLILGTLGLIPPADGAAPDQPPDGGPGRGPAGDPQAEGDPRPGDEDAPAGPGPGTGREGAPQAEGDLRPADDVPPPGDEDAPADDGLGGDDAVPEDPDHPAAGDGLDDGGVSPAWPGLPPVIPGVIPAALSRARARRPDRPVPGLLDLSVPYRTLAGLAGLPGKVGRLGPVTPGTAAHLAAIAAADPAAIWRVIVTGPAGHAIAVARIPRPRRGRGGPGPPPRAGPRTGPGGAGLVGRVTLTISRDILTRPPPGGPDRAEGELGGMLAAALRAAARAAEAADRIAAADAVAGGCAHTRASPHYRPPPRLREYIVARDVTCRSPACRQPAWQADLDHTRPWDNAGITCDCNLGGGCRKHHQLKQHPRWTLTQPRPGTFRWTTPAGRTYCATRRSVISLAQRAEMRGDYLWI